MSKELKPCPFCGGPSLTGWKFSRRDEFVFDVLPPNGKPWVASQNTPVGHLVEALAAQPAPATSDEATRWIVVKEHVWEHGDGQRPTLAYLWPSEFDQQVFPTFEAASKFIRDGEWPLGFVAMQIKVGAAHRREDQREYSTAIGEAGQAYLDTFPYAHPLPVQFRWNVLWDVMNAAAMQRTATPAPKKDFLNGWREAIEQLPVSREATPAEPVTPDDDCVICPGCAHQFRAISVNDQRRLADAMTETEYAVIINGTTYFVAYEVFELIEILREQMGKLRPVRICLETDIECTKGCTDICKGASNA